MGRKVAVNENGRTRQIHKIEVIVLRLVNDAMRGDAKATKPLLALIDKYGDPNPKLGNSDGTDTDRRTVIVVPHDGRDALSEPEQED